MLALLGLPMAAACEDGCGGEPPTNTGEPSLLIQTSSRQLEADGVSFAEVTVRAYDADYNPDNAVITAAVDTGEIITEEHELTNDGTQVSGTPENGVLTFRFACTSLETGPVTITATNGNASATSTVECVEPTGNMQLTLLVDEQYPCSDLLADGTSFCVLPFRADLVTASQSIPQEGVTLTAAVESATLTNPAEGQDPTVGDLALISADVDGLLPQPQVALTTGEDGVASLRLHSRLDQPMQVAIKVGGVADNGQAFEQLVNVVVRPFVNQAEVILSPDNLGIGAGLTEQLLVEARDHFGEVPAAGSGAVVTLEVPEDSGLILSHNGEQAQAGVLVVPVEGSAVSVDVTAPAVTEVMEFTVRGTYVAASFPPVRDSTVVTVYPDDSTILNVSADPAAIASDLNEVVTLEAKVTRFNDGVAAPAAGVDVRFVVDSLSRALVGFGTRGANQDVLVGDPTLALEVSGTTDSEGIATAQVSSRNARVRGIASLDVEVIENGAVVATRTVAVTLDRDPILQSIVFISATPQVIGVRGGSAPSTSVVTFQVLDDIGQPLVGVPLTFSLNATGDVDATAEPFSTTTDSNGFASTTVAAGTIANPVSVVATARHNDRIVTTESNSIAITGGLPSFANSYLQCDPATQAQVEPMSVNCTVALADRFTNDAPANIPVQFRSEGGNIDPVVFTGDNGAATANYHTAPPGSASTSLLSAGGDSWSYGAVIPWSASDTVEDESTRWNLAAEAGCFDADSTTSCSVFDLCFEAEHAVADLSDNAVYCPLLVDRDDVGCWNKLEAGAVTGDAAHLSDGLLASLGLTRAEAQTLLDTSLTPTVYYEDPGPTGVAVRAIVDAHLDNMFRCGPPTACITGEAAGVPFLSSDDCVVAQGCMDFSPWTRCPQDGLRTITAIVRGEESFTDNNGNGILDFEDLDGNGRHNPGEPTLEPVSDGSGYLPFEDTVVDMPEPFLDKDDNCFADDYGGSLRLSTYNAIRRNDLYNDEDGSGSYGYVIPGQGTEPQLTNGQWDRDKQIFFSDHVLAIQGGPTPEVGIPCAAVGQDVVCPYDNSSYLCQETGGMGGVLVGCYPRASDPVALPEGTAVQLRARWVDVNGNCYSPSFSHYTFMFDATDYPQDLDIDRSFSKIGMSRAYCGFGGGALDDREWCQSVAGLGNSPYLSFAMAPTCRANEAGTRPLRRIKVSLAPSDSMDFDTGDGSIADFSVDFRIDCTTP